MKKIVVMSGAGISAESGIKTFRDHDGLWENYNVTDVATPQAWARDPKMVLHFYNERRKQVINAEPNLAHRLLAKLEALYEVEIITQNIDDLHERAGSTNVMHLHGEIMKSRSVLSDEELYDVKNGVIEWGEMCSNKLQLRPHVVWFGEEVPNIFPAGMITQQADILIIIGTSLAVYPAAGLVQVAPPHAMKFLIDPGEVPALELPNLRVIKEKASTGMTMLAKELGLKDVI